MGRAKKFKLGRAMAKKIGQEYDGKVLPGIKPPWWRRFLACWWPALVDDWLQQRLEKYQKAKAAAQKLVAHQVANG